VTAEAQELAGRAKPVFRIQHIGVRGEGAVQADLFEKTPD